jgi:hypothetical protein
MRGWRRACPPSPAEASRGGAATSSRGQAGAGAGGGDTGLPPRRTPRQRRGLVERSAAQRPPRVAKPAQVWATSESVGV